MYRAAKLEGETYVEVSDSRGVVFKVMSNTFFEEIGNSRYANRAKKKQLYLLPLQIENNTDSSVFISLENLSIADNFQPIQALPFDRYFPGLMQSTWLYGLYIVAAAIPSYSGNDGIVWQPTPTWLLTIPGVINIIRSTKSNRLLEEELRSLDILNKEVGPHSTKKGIICLPVDTLGTVHIQLK